MVLGRESAGVDVEVGKGVIDFKAGYKVAIEPGVPSPTSDDYKSGHYNLCPHMCFDATPNSNPDGPNPPGSSCKYYMSPADFLVKLPEHVSLELGAMVEPLTAGVHASLLGRVTFGDHVVCFGAGPVGILAAAVARKFGAASSIGVATHIFNSMNEGVFSEALPAGVRPDVVLECTGAEICVQQVGNAGSDLKFPITEFVIKELTLSGSFCRGYSDYKISVAISDENYKNGKENALMDFEALITHRFPFEKAIEAHDAARAGDGAVKCIIDGPE